MCGGCLIAQTLEPSSFHVLFCSLRLMLFYLCFCLWLLTFFSAVPSWARGAASLTQLLLLIRNPRSLTLPHPQGEGCGWQRAGGDLAQEEEERKQKGCRCEKSAGGTGAAGTQALLSCCGHHSGVQSSACAGAVKMHRLPVSF